MEGIIVMIKLIIIDDEAIHRKGLSNLISKLRPNYEIFQFKDGDEALNFLNENEVDIIITDIRMPVLDGLSFIRKYNSRNTNAKMIILSAYAEFEYAQNAIGLGVFDYILKPVDVEKVIEILNKVEKSIKEDKNRKIKEINLMLTNKLKADKSDVISDIYIDYINNNYMNDISLDEIADKFHFNVSYFSTIFKEKMGMNFIKYLLKIRIEKSCEYLIGTDKKIYEIAELVGYKDCKYFNRVFKKEMLVSPDEYRRLNCMERK